MRLLGAVFSICLVLTACKKNPRVAAPVAREATPAPSATPVAAPVNLKSEVIVLCYHRFEDKPKDTLAINPADFEAQMQALKDSGIIVISMEDFLAWRRGEKAIPGSKEMLEKNLGTRVKAFAYPYGLHNQTVRDVVKQAGYEAAFTVWGRRIAYGADPMTIGRYAIESTKPKVFEEAVNFKGAVEGGGADAMPAAATMVTQPRDGETVSDSLPEIKANLATLGNVDPKSVTMRISGLGLVSATYNPETKLVSYKMTQKTYAHQVTVIVTATVNARKTEARWSFNIGSNEAPK
jgi:hypothetical protein